MNYTKTILLLSIFLFIGFGCQQKGSSNSTTSTMETKPTKETTSPTQPAKAANPYLIEEQSFLGITIGDDIGNYREVLEQGVLQSGEGEFEIYNIKSESGEVMGYVLASPQDASKVGTITITNRKASTKEGISIGKTFAELEAALGDLPVHGSEIESRTYAYKGHWCFLLDDYHSTYELDKSKVKQDAKIKEIDIRSNAYAK